MSGDPRAARPCWRPYGFPLERSPQTPCRTRAKSPPARWPVPPTRRRRRLWVAGVRTKSLAAACLLDECGVAQRLKDAIASTPHVVRDRKDETGRQLPERRAGAVKVASWGRNAGWRASCKKHLPSKLHRRRDPFRLGDARATRRNICSGVSIGLPSGPAKITLASTVRAFSEEGLQIYSCKRECLRCV